MKQLAHFSLALLVAAVALVGCNRRDDDLANPPTGAGNSTTSPSMGTGTNSGTSSGTGSGASTDNSMSGSGTTGGTTSGMGGTQGTSGQGTGVSPPASAASR